VLSRRLYGHRSKVHGGWIKPKFKGTPEEFRAKYVKQMKMLTALGFVLGSLYIVLAFVVAEDDANLVVKLLIGALLKRSRSDQPHPAPQVLRERRQWLKVQSTMKSFAPVRVAERCASAPSATW